MACKITFRMDDITSTMNWEKFNVLRDVFEKHEIYPLLGIVPNNEDPNLDKESARDDFWQIMRALRSRGWSISQHGYSHVYQTRHAGLLGINNRSEFAGRPYEDQLHDILAGKDILRSHGLESDVWMAPAHSYDKNTLLALKKAGFRHVTDGYSLWPYQQKGLGFIPSQTSKPIRLPVGYITVCLHANNMSSEDVGALDAFLSSNKSRCVSYSEALRWPNKSYFSGKIVEKVFLLMRRVRNLL